MSAAMRGLLVFIGLVLVVAFVCVGPAFFWLPQAGQGVSLPVITLPAEALVPNWPVFGYDFTNTLTSMVLVDVLIILIAVVVGRALRRQPPDRFVPRGFTNFIELIGEFLYNQAHGMLGKYTRAVLPLAASLFLFLFVANMVKLLPGVEAVGIIACAEPGQTGYPVAGIGDDLQPRAGMTLLNDSLVLGERAGTKATEADLHACEEKYPWAIPPVEVGKKERAKAAGVEIEGEHKEGEPSPDATEPASQGSLLSAEAFVSYAAENAAAGAAAAEGGNPDLFIVVPFFRGLATDLNLPMGLAIIVFVMAEFWGVRALGPSYFFKFINLPALGNLRKKPLGAIDFVVGLVEIISELSRLISLTFRLFGSIFAGGILLIVLSFLMAFIVPVPIYFLEIVIGAIQAYVFAILTIIYAQQAVVSHHDDHGEGHAEQAH